MGMIIINGEEYASSPKDGFPPIVYSDEEREIGVWRDGKPLYQKTIYCGALPNNTTKNITHNVNNIDFIVSSKGMAFNSTNNRWFPIPFVNDSLITSQVTLFVDTTNIVLRDGSDLSGFSKTFITIQYTKTTDIPGSGKYTTYGGLTHHYSTNEQVIGTWIDGKPIYEKVIETDQVINNSSQRLISKSDISSNLDQMIEFHGYYYDSNHSYMVNDNYYDNSDYHSMLIWEGNNFLSFIKMSSSSFPYLRIICRYTKTTD